MPCDRSLFQQFSVVMRAHSFDGTVCSFNRFTAPSKSFCSDQIDISYQTGLGGIICFQNLSRFDLLLLCLQYSYICAYKTSRFLYRIFTIHHKYGDNV